MSKKNKKNQKKNKVEKQSAEIVQKNDKVHPYLINTLLAFIIAVTTIALFYRTLDYGLVYCDDNIFVLDQQAYNQDPSNIKNSFKKAIGATYYRPILDSSFIIDHQMGKTDPHFYRRTNLAFHVMGSILLFFALMKFGYNRIPSFIMAMLFAVHPVISPSVSWISGRNDSMIAVFILLCFIFLINFMESGGAKKFVFYILSMLAYLIALFTKETTALLPFVGIAYIFIYHREKIFSKEGISLVTGWFILGLIWYAARKGATDHINTPDTIGPDALIQNFPTIFAMFGKMILPVKMHALANFEQLTIITGVVVLLLLLASMFVLKDINKGRAWFGFIWFFVFLLPTLLIRIIYVGDFFDYAEHRAYLVFLGFIIVLFEIFRALKINIEKPVPIAIASVIFVIFAIRTYAYEPVFQNRTTYWQNAVDVYPYKSRGYLDLGKAYYVEGKLDVADSLYHKGIELNPDNFNLYIDLSAVYIRQKNWKKAEEYAKKALALQPDNHLANYNLGKTYLINKRYDEALVPLEKALKRGKPHAAWFADLGTVYMQKKMYDKAINILNIALKRNRNIPMAYLNLGAAYANKNQLTNAEAVWLQGIKVSNKMYPIYQNLVQLYWNLGQTEKIPPVIKALEANGGKLDPRIRRIISGTPLPRK